MAKLFFTDTIRKIFNQLLAKPLGFYTENFLSIQTKSGALVPFQLNKAQQYVHEKLEEQKRKTGMVRAVVLKSRKQGVSTYVAARFFRQTHLEQNKNTFILSHLGDTTTALFKIVKRFYDNLPKELRPMLAKSNEKEMITAESDCAYNVGTANSPEAGRGLTVQNLHSSETGFYEYPEIVDSLFNAIAAVPGTEMIFESTANGEGNIFHRLWLMACSGEANLIPIFIPWFWDKDCRAPVTEKLMLDEEEQMLVDQFELTDEQLQWRRYKIAEASAGGANGYIKFKQEYPATPSEAFCSSQTDSFIPSTLVVEARKRKVEDNTSPLIMGVDIARFGTDRTVFCFRQGRQVKDVFIFSGLDTQEVAFKVRECIERFRPISVAIDDGGVGGGTVDRLRELGYGKLIVAVNSGKPAYEKDKYFNRRAELWAKAKIWLSDEQGVSLPDVEALLIDLAVPRYELRSGKLLIESKASIKDRGMLSTDVADAFILTFAPHVISPSLHSSIVTDVSTYNSGGSWMAG